MAGSRLEKIGTIYTRTSGLLKTGALNWEDRPLWYDIYEAFPPKQEPRFDKPAPNIKIKPIIYKEDKIRAIFHRSNKQIGATNLIGHKYPSLTQRFIDTYSKLEKTYGEDRNPEDLYKESIEVFNKEYQSNKKTEDNEEVSLSSAFKQAQSTKVKPEEAPKINVKLVDLFKN